MEVLDSNPAGCPRVVVGNPGKGNFSNLFIIFIQVVSNCI